MNELIVAPQNTEVTHIEYIPVANTDKVIARGTLHLHSRSPQTLKRYSNALKIYLEEGFSLPCTPEDLIKYIEHCVSRYKFSTIRIAMAAISLWHECHNDADPTKDKLVKESLKGAKRLTNLKPVQKAPLTKPVIAELFASFGKRENMSVKDVRDKALILTAFTCALRRSELVRLTHDDIEFTEYGLKLSIAPSKHDEEWHTLKISKNEQSSKYCVVAALREWLRTSQAHNDDIKHIFRPVTKGDTVRKQPLTANGVAKVIKARCRLAEFENWQSFSGHSMRRGFATQANNENISLLDIKEGGRWKHLSSVEVYIDAKENKARDALTRNWV